MGLLLICKFKSNLMKSILVQVRNILKTSSAIWFLSKLILGQYVDLIKTQ